MFLKLSALFSAIALETEDMYNLHFGGVNYFYNHS